MMRRFVAAIRFLTILPIPGSWAAREEDLAGSVAMFPLVGLLLGAAAAGLAWATALVAPPLLAAAVVVVAMLAFSGGLHMDGLSDSADGMLSSRSRERMLEIMKDSHVGAMGVIAIAAVMLLKFAALASVRPERFWIAAGLMPLAGRCAIVIQMAILRYVRTEGLGKVFCRRRAVLPAALAAGVLAGACAALLGWRGLVVAGSCVAAAAALSAYFHRKIGGSTGDTFGAACELVELVPGILLAAWPLEPARWLT